MAEKRVGPLSEEQKVNMKDYIKRSKGMLEVEEEEGGLDNVVIKGVGTLVGFCEKGYLTLVEDGNLAFGPYHRRLKGIYAEVVNGNRRPTSE